jgi:hypothetical protein
LLPKFWLLSTSCLYISTQVILSFGLNFSILYKRFLVGSDIFTLSNSNYYLYIFSYISGTVLEFPVGYFPNSILYKQTPKLYTSAYSP